MRAFGTTLFAILATLLMLPIAMAVDVGSGIGVNMETEKFPPSVWMCDHRIVYDDNVEPGRIVLCEDETYRLTHVEECKEILVERIEDYAFEGEQISWKILVMDKNGIEKVKDVYMTIGAKQSGSLQQVCALPDKFITIDGTLTESDWKKAFSVSGTCSYDIFMANDYHNLFVAFKKTGICPGNSFSMKLNTTIAAIDVLPMATANHENSNNTVAEYQIPLNSLGLTQGNAVKTAFSAFGGARFPQTGWQSFTLEAEKCHMEKVYNQIEANCMLDRVLEKDDKIDKSCNARIAEEEIKKATSDNTMAYYTCTFTVETPSSMHGEYFIAPEAEDLDGLKTPIDENEYWFLNPEIAVSIQGDLTFGTVRPGTSSYSKTLLIGNDAETGSGVLLDMFIAGTDFYDPASSGAKCPTTNQLALTNFAYFATNGAYSTQGKSCVDKEGYSGIPYGDRITQGKEIIGCDNYNVGPYKPGNVLTPGAEMALTFRLNLPEPCNGDFSDGQMYFWGEAV